MEIEKKEKVDTGSIESSIVLERQLDEAFTRLYERLKKEEKGGSLWGGFFRRLCALLVDVLVLSLFSILLFYLSYVGYSVGLTAHRQPPSEQAWILLRLLALAWLCLVSGYFVLLQGMEGRTIGKWLLGLKVVGADRRPITYFQAFVRTLGYLPSALFGLGFLWILWSREKRGWHDLLARTWVVRE